MEFFMGRLSHQVDLLLARQDDLERKMDAILHEIGRIPHPPARGLSLDWQAILTSNWTRVGAIIAIASVNKELAELIVKLLQ